MTKDVICGSDSVCECTCALSLVRFWVSRSSSFCARAREREERKRGKEREPTMMNKLYQHEFATLNESVVSLSRSARSLISSYFSLSESSRIFFLRSSRLAFRPKISTMMITKFEDEILNSVVPRGCERAASVR